MATTLSNKADAAFGRGEWREAALFARAAIENAAKAVLGAFASVPRSHEPRDILSEAVKLPGFPPGRRAEAQGLAESLAGYGMEQHILLSYGDETNHVDPWSLVTRAAAEAALGDAVRSVRFAESVFGDVFSP